ncbi:MAG: GerMN domain-containing protein, partial [Thermoleophilia bacterium]|nr:GerMN domain-containing protein [Thermoleophilia bacterium]
MLAAALAGLSAAASAQAATVQVYFTRGEQLAPVSRTVPAGVAPARFATTQLLAGPSVLERAVNVRTLVPTGVTLRRLTIAGGVAEVVLSDRFTQGAASTDALLGRLTQVVRTVEGVPGVRSVRVAVAGAGGAEQPVEGAAFDPGDLRPGGADPGEPAAPTGTLTPGPATTADVQRTLARLRYLPAGAVTGR